MHSIRARSLLLASSAFARTRVAAATSWSPLSNANNELRQAAMRSTTRNDMGFAFTRAFSQTPEGASASTSSSEQTQAAASSSEQAQEKQERVPVPKDLVRALIGRGGSNLKKLVGKVGGGSIKFSKEINEKGEEIALLAGSEQQLAELKKALLEDVERAKVEAANKPADAEGNAASSEKPKERAPRNNSNDANYVEEVIVDKFYVGALIGKEGAILKDMEKASGARIMYSDRTADSPERTARIRGTHSQVQAAKKLITEKIYAVAEENRNKGGENRFAARREGGSGGGRKHQPSPNDVKQVVEVPTECIGFLIGKGGRGLFDIQDRTTTKVDIARTDHRDGAREVTIFGLEENVQNACEIIQQRVKESYERNRDRA